MYNVVDLFAGAGGLSLGFEKTNKFNIIAAVENNKHAIKTYKYNNKNVKMYTDIRTLEFNELKDKYEQIDVVIGGPPCQGFSNANRQKRKIINGNNELVKRYVAAIDSLRPKVFVMENVKAMASNKHSFFLTQNDKPHIVDTLGIEVNRKDTIIYNNSYCINELYNLIQRNIYTKYMIDKENIDILNNISKSKDKLKKYAEKQSNQKAISNILITISKFEGIEPWYRQYIKEISNEFEKLLDSTRIDTIEIEKIQLFTEIQKLFFSINELNANNVIYHIILDDNMIVAQMDTYIVIEYIKRSFEYLGYKLYDKVLKAAAYGVPQKRERYILVGVKKEVINNNEITMPEPLISNEDDYLSVKVAIDDLKEYEASTNNGDYKVTNIKRNRTASFYSEVVRDSNVIFNHVCTDTRETALRRFKSIAAGQNFHDLPDELKTTYAEPNRTQNTIYKRLRYDIPSDTVVNVRKSMWIHPVLNRAISAREAARLQSFPDHYRFLGTKDSIYQQIGNAVPPLLGQAIAEKVLELLGDKPEKSLKEIYNAYNA